MDASKTPCFTEAVIRGCRWLQEGGDGQPLMLLGSRADVELARRIAADAGLSFGVRFETLASWASSAWGLLGDGRRIADDVERRLLVRRCLSVGDDAGANGTFAGAGFPDLVASIASQGLGLGMVQKSDPGLSPNELAALGASDDYRAALRRRDLVDLAEATVAVASDRRCRCRVAVVGHLETTAAQQEALDALGRRCPFRSFPYGFSDPAPSSLRAPELREVLARIYRTSAHPPVAPAGAVRFLLPAGAYASGELASAQIVEYLDGLPSAVPGDPCIVVAAKDPSAAFADLAPWLQRAGRGIRCALSETRAFEDTPFGRALLALVRFLSSDRCVPSLASDFVLSPLSGIGPQVAARLDERWRKDRLASRGKIVSDLTEANPDLQPLLQRLLASDFGGALLALRETLRAYGPEGTAEARSAAAACACAEGFASQCACCDVDPTACLDVLASLAVPCSGLLDAPAAEEGGAMVLVTSLERAAARPPCSCGLLVLLDMSASAYPVKAQEDPVGLLRDKLGFPRSGSDALGAHRRMVFRALETARDRIVLSRPRFDEGASESYPSVAWEEVADCYRASGYPLDEDGRAAVEDDGDLGVPKSLGRYALTAGERFLNGRAYGLRDGDGLRVVEVDRGDPFVLRAQAARAACAPAAADAAVALLSPSAIEAYLECPAKWFAERRLRIDSVDAQFSAREKGTFAHAVLKRTFERLAQLGVPKPDLHTLGDAKEVLGCVFDELLAAQAHLDANRGPLVALDALEAEEVRSLGRKLSGYLDREAALLPGFAPRWFELPFGSDEPFPYGGCLISGSIDRIDVNDRGQAVVIDYKGSVGAAYELASASSFRGGPGTAGEPDDGCGPDPEGSLYLPHRVQTLIYAQVVRRMLGLDVVGALYVPYGKPAGRAYALGSYDPGVLGEPDIPGIDGRRNGVSGELASAFGVGGFGELVDAVERRIASALCDLASGNVAPAPRGTDPCAWCAFASCPERRQ